MSSSRAGRGSTSPQSTASIADVKKKKHNKEGNEKNKPNNTVKFDMNLTDCDFDTDARVQMLRKKLEEVTVTLTMQSKVDAMMSMLEHKDKQISVLSEKVGMLTTEVEHLKETCNFLTKETTEMKTKCTVEATNTCKKLNFLESKSQDLEDRSRRNNLVIFGVPESDNASSENCDTIVCEILRNHNILDRNDTHQGLLERAHRLGRKKPDQQRPRPIIFCCGSFKDKEFILHNSNRLKGTPYRMAEDFSRATLDIRRELVQKGKEAKAKLPAVQSFQLKYRRLILKYFNTKTQKVFSWSFSVKDTQGGPNWFDLPSRNHTNQSKTPIYTAYSDVEGYQDSA